MKAFVFTLQKVLDFQQQLLEIKKQELAVMLAALKELEEEIERREARLAAENAALAEKMARGMTQTDMAVSKTFCSTLAKEIRQLRARLLEQRRLADQKEQEVLGIHREISGLERLRDKQRAEYDKHTQKQEEASIEDFVRQARARRVYG